MKRCIELLRVSTLGQADSDRASLPSQRTVNHRTAESFGLTIVRSIEMAGVSGATVLLAPEMQEMIRLMHDKEIHGVVTREFSRLMRPENYSDYALLQIFVETNTILYLPEGPINFATPDGRLMGTMKATIGGLERLELQKKIWNSREEKRKRKELGGSRVILPYGVTYPWAWTADAEKVREAFRLFLSGTTSYVLIAELLNVSPVGAKLILKNPIYTGWRVIDKKRDLTLAGKYATEGGRQGDRRKVQRGPDEIIRVRIDDLEPIVSESDFNRVQQIISTKGVNNWRYQEDYEHRFTYNGFLTCVCGSLIYTKYRRDDYYICRDRCGAKYMRKDRLESELDRLFTKRLTKPSFLKRHVLAPLKQKTQPAGNTALLLTQLESLQGKRKRILDSYFDGTIQMAERQDRIASVETERKTIEGILARQIPAKQLTVEVLAETFAPFMEFDLMNRAEKRRLLNTLTPSIVAKDYQIDGMWIGLAGGNDESLTDTGLVIATPSRLYLPLKIAA